MLQHSFAPRNHSCWQSQLLCPAWAVGLSSSSFYAKSCFPGALRGTECGLCCSSGVPEWEGGIHSTDEEQFNICICVGAPCADNPLTTHHRLGKSLENPSTAVLGEIVASLCS